MPVSTRSKWRSFKPTRLVQVEEVSVVLEVRPVLEPSDDHQESGVDCDHAVGINLNWHDRKYIFLPSIFGQDFK